MKITKTGRLVKIENFYSPQMDNSRTVRVYLPASYENNPTKSYPVLYMHDGQNIFDCDGGVKFYGSWKVDEAVDRLVAEDKICEIIVVGIDNTMHRAEEYCRYLPEYHWIGRMGRMQVNDNRKGYSIKYQAFLIDSVKAYIDSNFRTKSDRENTALMGSSMGGLVSYAIGFDRPDVFSMLGLISPAFNYYNSNDLKALTKQPLKIWMDAGECEAYYVENARAVLAKMAEVGFKMNEDVLYYQVPKAIHNEQYWAERIHMPLQFFFGKVGSAVSLELSGRTEYAVNCPDLKPNPIVTFDSGIKITDMDARFTSEKPEVLEIESNGHVVAKSVGKTEVTYSYDNLSVKKEFTAKEYIDNFVNVKFVVTVPSGTPADAEIYLNADKMHLMQKNSDGKFEVTLPSPRDWGYKFNIHMGAKYTCECDEDGKTVPNNIMKMTDDVVILYAVKKWLL